MTLSVIWITFFLLCCVLENGIVLKWFVRCGHSNIRRTKMSIMILPGAWAHLVPKASGIVTGYGTGQWLAWTMCIERDQWGLTPVLLTANLNQCSQACYQPELPGWDLDGTWAWMGPGQPSWPSACPHPHGDAWFPELGLPLLPSGLPCSWGKPGAVEASAGGQVVGQAWLPSLVLLPHGKSLCSCRLVPRDAWAPAEPYCTALGKRCLWSRKWPHANESFLR